MDRRRAAGELENDVLAALWAAHDPLSPADVQAAVPGNLAYTTVHTILLRLRRKQLVAAVPVGCGVRYRPTKHPADLTAEQMHAALRSESNPAAVLQTFVTSLTPTDTAALRALLSREEPLGRDFPSRVRRR